MKPFRNQHIFSLLNRIIIPTHAVMKTGETFHVKVQGSPFVCLLVSETYGMSLQPVWVTAEKQRLVLKDRRKNKGRSTRLKKHHPSPPPPTADIHSWVEEARVWIQTHGPSPPQRGGCNIIALVPPDVESPSRAQRWWRRKEGGESRAEENCKAEGLRRGEARRGEASVMQKLRF